MLMGSTGAADAAPLVFGFHGHAIDDLSASVLFSYAAVDDRTGRLDIRVTNTSAAFDPRLTAFAFNLPDAVAAVTAFGSASAGWTLALRRNGIDSGRRFGSYDIGALTGPDLGAGARDHGIARGATARFSFDLTGSGMRELTEMSFLELLSYDAPGGKDELERFFAGRFDGAGKRGAHGDIAAPNAPPSAAVPEPVTLLLTGMGLFVLAACGRRRV
jgi:hypothetical protein